MPFFVVAHIPSTSTSPAAFNTQYRLVLSPRPIPIVTPSDLRNFVVVLRVELFEILIFFFMARFPFLIAPRVRSLGSLTLAREETGLLIPSRNELRFAVS